MDVIPVILHDHYPYLVIQIKLKATFDNSFHKWMKIVPQGATTYLTNLVGMDLYDISSLVLVVFRLIDPGLGD